MALLKAGRGRREKEGGGRREKEGGGRRRRGRSASFCIGVTVDVFFYEVWTLLGITEVPL